MKKIVPFALLSWEFSIPLVYSLHLPFFSPEVRHEDTSCWAIPLSLLHFPPHSSKVCQSKVFPQLSWNAAWYRKFCKVSFLRYSYSMTLKHSSTSTSNFLKLQTLERCILLPGITKEARLLQNGVPEVTTSKSWCLQCPTEEDISITLHELAGLIVEIYKSYPIIPPNGQMETWGGSMCTDRGSICFCGLGYLLSEVAQLKKKRSFIALCLIMIQSSLFACSSPTIMRICGPSF